MTLVQQLPELLYKPPSCMKLLSRPPSEAAKAMPGISVLLRMYLKYTNVSHIISLTVISLVIIHDMEADFMVCKRNDLPAASRATCIEHVQILTTVDLLFEVI